MFSFLCCANVNVYAWRLEDNLGCHFWCRVPFFGDRVSHWLGVGQLGILQSVSPALGFKSAIPPRPAFLCRFWELNCKASTLPFEPCPSPIYLLIYELCLSSVFGSNSKRADEVAPTRDRGAEI